MPTLPAVVRDRGSQENFDALDKRTTTAEGKFPVAASDLSVGAKELFPQLVSAGSHKVDFGTAKLKFTASKFPASIEVAHGLGTTPLVVIATSENNVVTLSTAGYTATKFTLWGGNWFEALTGELPVHWIAIG